MTIALGLLFALQLLAFAALLPSTVFTHPRTGA